MTKILIETQNLKKSYQQLNGNITLFNNLNLKIKQGDLVAVVGPSGSGKSTLISLIPRFYDVQEGDIFIDGINIKNYDLQYLRSLIAIVPQEPFLFSGSIYENILIGNPLFSVNISNFCVVFNPS